MIQKDRNFLIQVAKRYYEEGLSQQEIARSFGISRPTVSNLLKQCREEKIVEIRIQESEDSLSGALSDRLRSRFGLKTVSLVPHSEDRGELQRRAGAAAAELLRSRLRDRIKIGVSWGSSLYHAVQALPSRSVVDAEVIQMTGSLGMVNPSCDGFELARNLASKLGGACRLIQAPVSVKNRELKRLLLQEHPIRKTMEMMGSIELALVGISSDDPAHSAMVRENFLSRREAAALQEKGGAGHICAYHFDREGRLLDAPENDMILGIGWHQLKALPEVVAVAYGKEKTQAVLAALKGGLIHSLVTDESTALRVLGAL